MFVEQLHDLATKNEMSARSSRRASHGATNRRHLAHGLGGGGGATLTASGGNEQAATASSSQHGLLPRPPSTARSALTTLKASEWRENAAPRRPGAGDGSMYLSDSARMGLRMAPLAGKSAKGRFQFGYE